MIRLYDLWAESKARTEVLPLAFARARLIYWPADIRARLIYRIGYLSRIKYRLSAITSYCLFFRASTSALAFYLLSITCVCNSLSLEED